MVLCTTFAEKLPEMSNFHLVPFMAVFPPYLRILKPLPCTGQRLSDFRISIPDEKRKNRRVVRCSYTNVFPMILDPVCHSDIGSGRLFQPSDLSKSCLAHDCGLPFICASSASSLLTASARSIARPYEVISAATAAASLGLIKPSETARTISLCASTASSANSIVAARV